ncbi:MAG: hypothetical protein WBB62_07325 [Rhodococcus sp. (in: high G+C Gram-positive bacteria)]
MPKIGKFKSEEHRGKYMAAYDRVEQLWPSTAPAQTMDVTTTFGSTHVRRWGMGTGAPLVLLHPMAGNSLVWHSFAEELGRDRVVYALDTIGTAGKSVQTEPITKGTDYATWVDDVLTGHGVLWQMREAVIPKITAFVRTHDEVSA